MGQARQFDRSAMRRHLEWLVARVRETHRDLRFEITWADPESGPNGAEKAVLIEQRV
jgi:hypothetical protein